MFSVAVNVNLYFQPASPVSLYPPPHEDEPQTIYNDEPYTKQLENELPYERVSPFGSRSINLGPKSCCHYCCCARAGKYRPKFLSQVDLMLPLPVDILIVH